MPTSKKKAGRRKPSGSQVHATNGDPSTIASRGAPRKVAQYAQPEEHALVREARSMIDATILCLGSFGADVANNGAAIARVYEAATGRKPSSSYEEAFALLPSVERTLKIESAWFTLIVWIERAATERRDARWLVDALHKQAGLVVDAPDLDRVQRAIDGWFGKRPWVDMQEGLSALRGETAPRPANLSRMWRAWSVELQRARRAK